MALFAARVAAYQAEGEEDESTSQDNRPLIGLRLLPSVDLILSDLCWAPLDPNHCRPLFGRYLWLGWSLIGLSFAGRGCTFALPSS